jgi:hypothetical protein
MIAVIMGDEHQIRLPGLIPRHGAGRVMREEGIYENSHVAARNLKIGMTVPSNGNAHGILLKIKKKKGKRNKRMDTKTRLRHQTSRSTLPVPEHTA